MTLFNQDRWPAGPSTFLPTSNKPGLLENQHKGLLLADI